jgi:hypothetical protein
MRLAMHGAQTQGGVCPHKVGLAIASHQLPDFD